MKNNKSRGIKILKIVVVIAFLLCSVFVALRPMENSVITVEVKTTDDVIREAFDPDTVAGLSDTLIMDGQGADLSNFKNLRIYRKYSTISLDKIAANQLPEYGAIDGNQIIFNANFVNEIKGFSKSMFYERLITIIGLFAVALLLWIILEAIGEKLNPANVGNHGPIYETKKFFGEIAKYRQYMNFAARADLKAEVANSYLNRLWWLLEPFFNMLVYVIVFGKLMGNSVEHYATFVFSALLMWSFFNKTINYSVKCVRNNKDIVTKVYVPKHVLLISNMYLNFYKLLFSLIVLIPMLIGYKVQIGLAVFWVIPAYVLMLIFSFGVGMILLHFGVYIDDLGYAVGILLNMAMFLSGVFYDVTTGLSSPLNALMMCCNPIAMFIDTMRNALLYNTIVNVPLIVIWTVISLLLAYIGVHIVYKNENGYVKVV